MRNKRVGGYCSGRRGRSGSDGGMVGVKRGDMLGEVGWREGLKETKKTALVMAPETFWRWT